MAFDKPAPGQWPALSFNDLKDTLITVQLWTQIVGKIRLRKMPWINHSWHVTLYVSATGLTTGSIPFDGGIFEINFNFQVHQLQILLSSGKAEQIPLYPRSVASFYNELTDKLSSLGISADIHGVPNELDNPIAFKDDEIHRSYDAAKIEDFWKILVNVHVIFSRFRANFTGKCSPVHFFWGAFDLAVTRFSGRKAPKYEGKRRQYSFKGDAGSLLAGGKQLRLLARK